MSFRRLLNHHVVPYRSTPVRDVFGGTKDKWLPQDAPAGRNARPDQNWSGNLQDHGPGEQQGAMRRWFLHRGVDVAERDVLDVQSGPEAPALLRVESVTPVAGRRGNVHHIEVNVEVWQGDLGIDDDDGDEGS